MRNVLAQTFDQSRYWIGTTGRFGPDGMGTAWDIFPEGATSRLPIFGRTLMVRGDQVPRHQPEFARVRRGVQATAGYGMSVGNKIPPRNRTAATIRPATTSSAITPMAPSLRSAHPTGPS